MHKEKSGKFSQQLDNLFKKHLEVSNTNDFFNFWDFLDDNSDD